MRIQKTICLFLLVAFVALVSACSPEVGSDEWCKNMKEKPKKDWTASEAANYTKYCIFK